ncbi:MULTISPECIES: hypothetical protein [Streptomyces]|uniref:Uncharacterized protein n=1 Tax=Streptomyces venezuelae (strain ATCC 10712 / CBS 650.69 / DSM 40230 / JCM 4526 / NBRC 13096 / PD 04745) TaxID=953739 RepID=F2RL14_STRVP|nr:hypothetical protein [Streptomyces venezuelae]APE21382.1 hypothetical protein vnz_10350 [Streptomyces venezuelae]QER98772.1 hypothetical protein DEJ43_10485 [Streptomyces venezuelae ATCC 10712]CCA55403.1 hypothetical protein SVEN_2117 [Streptomyces venezuelae ATCC 10712]
MSKSRLIAGTTYDWMVTSQVGQIRQEHWGHVLGSGETEDEQLEHIRRVCAERRHVPLSEIRIVSAVFTPR